MKDSKEKEQRISNLKDMMEKITKENQPQDSFEEDFDEFEGETDDYEIVDAEEMIDELSEDYNKYSNEELSVDSDLVFKPTTNIADDDESEKDEIDDEFIIKTKLEDSEIQTDGQTIEEDDISYDDEDFLSEKFDSIFDKKIKGYSITSITSLILGIILILVSIFLFCSSTQRIIDNVMSGEMNSSGVIFLLIGVFLVVLAIYQMKIVKNPFEDVANSISDIEKETNDEKQTKSTKKSIPNNIEDIKKVGEVDIAELKNNIENRPTKKQDKKDEDLDDESIEDIFSEMEEVPIISIDSKEEK